MNKLISYLQSLVSALLNKVPESASPKRAYSNQQISGASQQVVSPIDGWAALSVSNAISNTAHISARTSNGFAHQHSISSTQHSASLHIPVRKGDTVTVGQGGFASGVWLNFFERIGGGLKAHSRALVYSIYSIILTPAPLSRGAFSCARVR